MQRDIIKQAILDAWPQFDVVTAAELSEAGIGEKLRRAAVRFGIIYRLRRGAYVRADLWHSCGAQMQDLMRIRAHFLTTPHAGTYSHATAARLHGLHTWDISSTIHLIQPFASTRNAHGPDTVSHHQHLDRHDVVTLRGPRGLSYTVTSPERTVIDCACSLEFHRAAVIGDHALRKGADRAKVAAILESMAGKRGVRKGRAVVESLDARAESPGETRTRLLFQSFGIQMPEPQIELVSRAGRHRGDFGWRELRLIAEFDGRTKYFDYKPTDQAIFEERRREKALMEDDWTFFRIEWDDLSAPAVLKSRLLSAMDKAAAWVRLRAS